jgi:phage shock protein PspC (stress-responsive transcriptional regulator)
MMSMRSWFAARGLVRPRRGRWIAGVAAGLARRFDVPVSHMRLLWVLSILLPGPQIVLYIALWILMPAEPPEPGSERT